MAKTFFKLTGAYEGLQARRLKWTGRLVLYQIINDGAPYWLVRIQNFDPTKMPAGTLKFIDPAKIGTWRFVDLQSANQKYEQLAPFFPPRKYAVPPPASAARLAELRGRRRKSLGRTEQGPDLVSIIRQRSVEAGKRN